MEFMSQRAGPSPQPMTLLVQCLFLLLLYLTYSTQLKYNIEVGEPEHAWKVL